MNTDRKSSLLDFGRLWRCLIFPISAWAVFSVIIFPIIYWWLRLPNAKIAGYLGVCCVVQLASSLWLFYARKTPQRPDGRIVHRTAAVTFHWATVSMLFFYYLRDSRPQDPAAREFTSIGMGGTLILAIVFPLVRLVLQRNKAGLLPSC